MLVSFVSRLSKANWFDPFTYIFTSPTNIELLSNTPPKFNGWLSSWASGLQLFLSFFSTCLLGFSLSSLASYLRLYVLSHRFSSFFFCFYIIAEFLFILDLRSLWIARPLCSDIMLKTWWNWFKSSFGKLWLLINLELDWIW